MIIDSLQLCIRPKCFKSNGILLDFQNRVITENGKNTVNGVQNGILEFDSNNYYSFGATGLTSKTFSINCLIKKKDALLFTIASFGNDASGQGRILIIDTYGNVCLKGDTGYQVRNDTGRISDLNWHHISFCCDGSKGLVYIDGVLVITDTSPSWGLSVANDTGILGYIGCDLAMARKGNFSMKGLSIYTKYLTQGEVLNNMLDFLPLNPDKLYLKDENDNWFIPRLV